MAFANSRLLAVALLCLAPLTGTAAGTTGEPSVTIELRPQVTASRSTVSLGDIAYLTTRDLPLLRQLMALPLGPAPRPGSPVSLDRETVMRWVQARSGLQAADGEAMSRLSSIRWTGAGQTEVESASQYLSGETIVTAAQSALVKWLAARSARADVQPVSTARDLVLPAGAPTLRVRPLPDQAVPGKRMLVWVDAWVDDRFVRTTAVSFEVEAWTPMAVATTNIERGTVLDPVVSNGALARREVDLAGLKGGAPVDANMTVADASSPGKRLRRPLQAGEVLTEAHLEAAPAVVRGNWAQLQAHVGDVLVEGRVEVLQDGRKGQLVRVKMPGANGEVMARVTGPGQVEVQQ